MSTRLFTPHGEAAVPARKMTLGSVTTSTAKLPNRFLLHGPTGFGKTSILSHAPRPVFLETRGETGLETLIDARQIEETPHFPELRDWTELRGAVDVLIADPHEYRTLILDVVDGAERLCHEHICERDFRGDWGENGFLNYGKGPEVALQEWKLFLNQLDRLRAERKMGVWMLAHSKLKTFHNPEGPDFDRWQPDMNEKTWTVTDGWVDAVFFGNFEVTVQTGRRVVDPLKKGKALQQTSRMLYTQERPAYKAKNRFGLPEEIAMGESSREAWAALVAAMKQARGEGEGGAKPTSAKQEATIG